MVDYAGQKGHEGNIWAAARRWGLNPSEFLDYSANINPLGSSPRSWQAIEDNLSMLGHYPDPACGELKSSLARHLQVDPGHLVLGNGGSEIIYLLARLFGRARILRLAPTFTEYGEGLEESHVIEIPLAAEDGFPLPVQALNEAMESGDLIFLGNPNNPTGNLFSRSDLEAVISQAVRVGAVVALDEAFIDFTGRPSDSLRDLAPSEPHLIVVGSLTKFFAIPALRLGYAIAAPEHIRRMERLLPAWRINTLAQVAAAAGLADGEYIAATLKLVEAERVYLSTGLSNIGGLKVFDSAANFLLVDGRESRWRADELQNHLGPKGILIRQCHNFANLSPYHFRLAVRTRRENEILLEILQKVMISK